MVETPEPEAVYYDADEEFEFDNKSYDAAGRQAV